MSGRLAHLALLLAITAVVLSACGRDIVSYLDEDATYTQAQLQTKLEGMDAGAVALRSRAEAVGLRHEALTQLRSNGTRASAAADLITRVFPASTASVPVYVERATLDGIDALVIVEAWGEPDGRLSAKRLWALEATSGNILFSAATPSGR